MGGNFQPVASGAFFVLSADWAEETPKPEILRKSNEIIGSSR